MSKIVAARPNNRRAERTHPCKLRPVPPAFSAARAGFDRAMNPQFTIAETASSSGGQMSI
jgi:hypothetical protein